MRKNEKANQKTTRNITVQYILKRPQLKQCTPEVDQ